MLDKFVQNISRQILGAIKVFPIIKIFIIFEIILIIIEVWNDIVVGSSEGIELSQKRLSLR